MSQTMMVTITPHTRVEEDRSILQRAKLPTMLFFLQASFVVLFGVFVRYAPVAMPNKMHWNTTSSAPNANDSSAPNGTTTATTVRQWVLVDPSGAARHDIDYPKHIPDNYAIYQDIQVMMFVGFGFISTYLFRYGLSGISYNFLLGAMCIQWATLTDGWIRRLRHQSDYYIYVNINTMIDSDYAICSALVSFGAVLGKVSLLQLAIMGMFQMAIYQANCLMIYDLLNANDPGHSMTVHIFGAYFGLTIAAIINHKEVEEENRKKGGSVYHSDILAMIGTLFLWTLFPSFNAAYAVDEGRIRAIINTYFSLTSSVMTAFAVSSICNRDKFSMLQVQNATIAGGIAVGTIAEMIIQPWGALLVGFVAGIVSTLGLQYFTPCLGKRVGLHDTRGINNVHGLPGLISAFGSILAAGVATQYKYGDGLLEIFHDKNGHQRTLGQQAGYQAAALAVTLGTAVLGGILTGNILRLPIWDQPRYDDILDDEPRWVSVVDLPGNEYKSRDDFALASKRGVAVTEFTATKEQ